MTINFSSLLSPQTRERLARTAVEIGRLYRLPNRWLAEQLLKLTRQLRRDYPDKLGYPYALGYDAAFAWHLVPEIAKRLGATLLLPNEATEIGIMTLQGQDFREYAGVFLNNIVVKHWPHTGCSGIPSAAELLAHSIANGNPVAIAIDRLYPAPPRGQDRHDAIARQIREVSHYRGHAETAYWSPDLQQKIIL